MVAPTAMLAPKNNAASSLVAVMDGATSPITFSVTAGQGTLFPQPTTDGPFMVSIDSEILKCTARTTDALTCTRAQEGTSIAAHANGSSIQLRITAQSVSDIHTVLRGLSRVLYGQMGRAEPASTIGGGTGGLSVDGLLNDISVTAGGASARTIGANGVSADLVSGAGAGDNAGFESVLVTRTDLSPVLAGRIYIPTIVSVRGFFGLTDQTLDTMISADNPAGNYAGLVFNDGAHANWRFVRKDNTTQTFTNTALVLAITPRFFLLEASAASLTLSLYDAAFALLYNTTVTTLLPTSTASLRVVCGLENPAGGALTLGIYSVLVANHIGRVTVL
jgi:hypothetical protein